jgi:hypothetical protein
MYELSGKKPPSRSKGLISDVIYFLLHKPEKATLIKFESVEERDNYNQRVMQ